MRRVCIFCGANPGHREGIVAAARTLGALLAERGVGVVFGGSSAGVMGAIADAAVAHGGSVIGVLPQVLTGKEAAHGALRQMLAGEVLPEHPQVWFSTVGMAERKALMAEYADGFLALPGGYGTLDEIFEMLTWTQIGVHQKRVCLWNLDGFYDHLVAFLDRAVEDGLLLPKNRALLDVVTTVEDAVAWSAGEYK
jgi:hypothetical protein